MIETDILEGQPVQILSVRPGDVVVFVGPFNVSPERARAFADKIKTRLPAGVECLFTSGVRVDAVLRPEATS